MTPAGPPATGHRWLPSSGQSLALWLKNHRPSAALTGSQAHGCFLVEAAKATLSASYRLGDAAARQQVLEQASQAADIAGAEVQRIQNDDRIPVHANKTQGKSKKFYRDQVTDRLSTELMRLGSSSSDWHGGKWMLFEKASLVDRVFARLAVSAVSGALARVEGAIVTAIKVEASSVEPGSYKAAYHRPSDKDERIFLVCVCFESVWNAQHAKVVLENIIREYGEAPFGCQPDLYAEIKITSKHPSGLRPKLFTQRELLNRSEMTRLRAEHRGIRQRSFEDIGSGDEESIHVGPGQDAADDGGSAGTLHEVVDRRNENGSANRPEEALSSQRRTEATETPREEPAEEHSKPFEAGMAKQEDEDDSQTQVETCESQPYRLDTDEAGEERDKAGVQDSTVKAQTYVQPIESPAWDEEADSQTQEEPIVEVVVVQQVTVPAPAQEGAASRNAVAEEAVAQGATVDDTAVEEAIIEKPLVYEAAENAMPTEESTSGDVATEQMRADVAQGTGTEVGEKEVAVEETVRETVEGADRSEENKVADKDAALAFKAVVDETTQEQAGASKAEVRASPEAALPAVMEAVTKDKRDEGPESTEASQSAPPTVPTIGHQSAEDRRASQDLAEVDVAPTIAEATVEERKRSPGPSPETTRTSRDEGYVETHQAPPRPDGDDEECGNKRRSKPSSLPTPIDVVEVEEKEEEKEKPDSESDEEPVLNLRSAASRSPQGATNDDHSEGKASADGVDSVPVPVPIVTTAEPTAASSDKLFQKVALTALDGKAAAAVVCTEEVRKTTTVEEVSGMVTAFDDNHEIAADSPTEVGDAPTAAPEACETDVPLTVAEADVVPCLVPQKRESDEIDGEDGDAETNDTETTSRGASKTPRLCDPTDAASRTPVDGSEAATAETVVALWQMDDAA
ncbi:hypothetical protein ACQY0O_003844 [Thecaphora frezii]